MARFFVTEHAVSEGKITITGPDVKHISRVLRLEPGDALQVVVKEGAEYEAVITEITGQAVFCQVTSEKKDSTEPPIGVTLYQGLPKGDKMELIIQKGTEVGISRIVPVFCERTVVKLDDKKARDRQVRWQRIAEEAAKQCGRINIPKIELPVKFSSAVSETKESTFSIMPWEEYKSAGLKSTLEKASQTHIEIFIGPEGGFSKSEAELAQSKGIHLVSLGPRIMRTETAGIVTAALVLYELGDLGGAEHG